MLAVPRQPSPVRRSDLDADEDATDSRGGLYGWFTPGVLSRQTSAATSKFGKTG